WIVVMVISCRLMLGGKRAARPKAPVRPAGIGIASSCEFRACTHSNGNAPWNPTSGRTRAARIFTSPAGTSVAGRFGRSRVRGPDTGNRAVGADGRNAPPRRRDYFGTSPGSDLMVL